MNNIKAISFNVNQLCFTDTMFVSIDIFSLFGEKSIDKVTGRYFTRFKTTF